LARCSASSLADSRLPHSSWGAECRPPAGCGVLARSPPCPLFGSASLGSEIRLLRCADIVAPSSRACSVAPTRFWHLRSVAVGSFCLPVSWLLSSRSHARCAVALPLALRPAAARALQPPLHDDRMRGMTLRVEEHSRLERIAVYWSLGQRSGFTGGHSLRLSMNARFDTACGRV